MLCASDLVVANCIAARVTGVPPCRSRIPPVVSAGLGATEPLRGSTIRCLRGSQLLFNQINFTYKLSYSFAENYIIPETAVESYGQGEYYVECPSLQADENKYKGKAINYSCNLMPAWLERLSLRNSVALLYSGMPVAPRTDTRKPTELKNTAHFRGISGLLASTVLGASDTLPFRFISPILDLILQKILKVRLCAYNPLNLIQYILV
ncbi:hypothetical protein KQX54_007896 [Cotesia glomerata]|uniref:Uncharacterized protein n=1 Tax=Cotesia glomerata TaxID=32391 RepID=A0AAV7HHZ0_COTGL|nr:hypothetical protein KQX54_007896 [Cotesia glomerata]